MVFMEKLLKEKKKMLTKMLKKGSSEKGFTLMEMLIVVAIIAILIAIAIPTFNSSLNKAKDATDLANARSLYSAAKVEYMTSGAIPAELQAVTAKDKGGTVTYDGTTYSFNKAPTITYTDPTDAADGTVIWQIVTSPAVKGATATTFSFTK
jgi:prepilin-type N-terminal cleavage/methylation domain-containing protein